MKQYVPLSLSLALGFTTLAASMLSPAQAAETAEVALEPVEFSLAEATDVPQGSSVLPQVTVQSTKHREQEEDTGYQPPKTNVGKTMALPKDIPQSLTIVPIQLMKDRNANTLKEALRNVAGLTFNAGEGGRIGDNITLRGYSAVGDLYLDGLRDMAQYNRETFNLDRVEVLRGSASMLYGRGSTGGLINQVSKMPINKDRTELNVTGGSFSYRRATLDVNRKLSDKLLFRLNTMVTDTDSYRNDVFQKRWGIAPTLTYNLGGKNEVSASYYFLQEHNLPDYGVPYYHGSPLNVPINRYFGMANVNYERNRTGIGTLSYTHRFNENSVLKSVVRYANYARDLDAVAPRLIGVPPSLLSNTPINRQRQARGGLEHVLTGQSEYNGKFATGYLKHEVMAGVAYNWERSERWTNSNGFVNPRGTFANPDSSPVLPVGFFDRFNRTAFNYYNGRTISAYSQDTVRIAPHLKLLMGTRFDHMHANYERPQPNGPLERNDNMWSSRGGLMYQPNDISTYYVCYGTSYNPSAELYQLDDRTSNTPPEKSQNLEGGAKWDLLHGNLSLRTAVFRTQKFHERNTDLSRPTVSLLTGQRHTDGVEFEAAGRLTKNWELFSSMALMRSNVDKASAQQANSQDKRPVNTPNYTYGLWTTYKFKFHGKWKVGVGLEGVGKRFANADNSNAVPGYQRLDAMVEYELDRYSLKLNAFNLLNAKYYEGVYTGHVVPGTSRAIQISLGMKR
jgi:catecholate siderophore receptor